MSQAEQITERFGNLVQLAPMTLLERRFREAVRGLGMSEAWIQQQLKMMQADHTGHKPLSFDK